MARKKDHESSSGIALREQLIDLLHGGHAHTNFLEAVGGIPHARLGIRPEGLPHSPWELLEHMRIAQNDILLFSQSAEYVSPEWPQGYWPASPAPANQKEWDASVRSFQDDLDSFVSMLRDPSQDLYTRFPWGDGQTLLREALVLADHNSYHLGQLVLVRRLLGAWNA